MIVFTGIIQVCIKVHLLNSSILQLLLVQILQKGWGPPFPSCQNGGQIGSRSLQISGMTPSEIMEPIHLSTFYPEQSQPLPQCSRCPGCTDASKSLLSRLQSSEPGTQNMYWACVLALSAPTVPHQSAATRPVLPALQPQSDQLIRSNDHCLSITAPIDTNCDGQAFRWHSQ